LYYAGIFHFFCQHGDIALHEWLCHAKYFVVTFTIDIKLNYIDHINKCRAPLVADIIIYGEHVSVFL